MLARIAAQKDAARRPSLIRRDDVPPVRAPLDELSVQPSREAVLPAPASGLSQSGGLTFADLFDLHYAWLTEPAFPDWQTRFPASGRADHRLGLLERLHALAASQQDRDLSDDSTLEALLVDPALGLAA